MDLNDKANLEAKAKLFALYLGQKVLIRDDFNKSVPVIILPFDLAQTNSSYLLLRTVKQLSQTEEEIFAKLCHWNEPITDFHIDFEISEVCFTKRDAGYVTITLDGWGHLRSIGIIIPFTTIINGEVKTYEVEEILANNWAKVRED